MSLEWSPTAVFSPSKAREQIAQAKEWSRVDAWLASKFGGTMPRDFERNSETLKILVSLAAFNEAADEERGLVQQVQARAVEELRQQLDADVDIDSIEAVKGNLTNMGETSLQTVASISVACNSTSVEPHKLGPSIIDITQTQFDLDQQLSRITALQEQLDSEIKRLNTALLEVQSESFSTPASLSEKTAEWSRNTRHLQAKLLDYKDRIDNLPTDSPAGPEIPDIVREERKLRKMLGHVENLEEQVKSYQGLPQDKALARAEVEAVTREFRMLENKREGLFQNLIVKSSTG